MFPIILVFILKEGVDRSDNPTSRRNMNSCIVSSPAMVQIVHGTESLVTVYDMSVDLFYQLNMPQWNIFCCKYCQWCMLTETVCQTELFVSDFRCYWL